MRKKRERMDGSPKAERWLDNIKNLKRLLYFEWKQQHPCIVPPCGVCYNNKCLEKAKVKQRKCDERSGSYKNSRYSRLLLGMKGKGVS